MEIKIKFDLFNEMLNDLVKLKKDYDLFIKNLEETSIKIKGALNDINALIIIFIIIGWSLKYFFMPYVCIYVN